MMNGCLLRCVKLYHEPPTLAVVRANDHRKMHERGHAPVMPFEAGQDLKPCEEYHPMRRSLPEVFEVRQSSALPFAPSEVVRVLEPLITEARSARMKAAVQRRTRHVVPLLDDVADPHNVSAILRTCEGLGIQEVHMTESLARGFAASHRVTRGAEKWLTLVRHESPHTALRAMQAQGYQVVAAVMDGELRVDELARFPRVVTVFGNEHKGVRREIREIADHTFCIPMAGFVESFNVSVAVGMTLYELTRARRQGLSPDEQTEVYARWLMTSVHDAEQVLRRELSAKD